ncbi:MAG: hypothetical protein Q4G22_07025 [Paracoccus sp. (in: a-proteobacteria)]|uniref:hypothetical protein n=1 Tax=Paracoccus sp. TaxID=267 RepID=UPI0026E07B8B|nr:hypothetical protein [Paracoccus sp. (in: a-proteobacteria)]MDO5631573.1 hypothetical protein [Paracoccus sp. (in: a-proteobacteria)]
MRLSSPLILGAAALALSGCVVATPFPAPVPTAPVTTAPTAPVATTPTTLDAASRAAAQAAITTAMQASLPGTNATPYTNCVMQNATTAELIDIAQMSRANVPGVADSVAAIVRRPATTACISAAARTA